MRRYTHIVLRRMPPLNGFSIKTPEAKFLSDIRPRGIVRELNRLNDRIKRLEKELTDTKRKQSVLVSDVVLYEDRGERIKQMEEVGDEMLNWLTDDGISMENLRLIANAWRKAKEAKP